MASCNYEPWSLRDLALALVDKHKDNKEIVVPMYQRGKRWKSNQEVDFIDSLEKGFPVGTMLFFRQVDGKKEIYTLVDGLQRSNTIRIYMSKPTKYFESKNIPEKVTDQIYSILALSGSEIAIKNKINEIIIHEIQLMNSIENIQYYDIARGITSEIPSMTPDAVHLITKAIEPFLKEYSSKYKTISETTIPVIVYTGKEESLPSIFDRINSKGTPLTQYEVFAASWPLGRTIRCDNDKIINYILKKYDSLVEDQYEVQGYDRDKIRTEKKVNCFEYMFGFSKYLNDTYPMLHFSKNSDADEINAMGFELVNACLNSCKEDIPHLHVDILKISDINNFESKLKESIEFVQKEISGVTNFKGNYHGGDKILHPKYLIMSMIAFVFREKYDPYNLLTTKKDWKEHKKLIEKYMVQHFVHDILSGEWDEGGTNKIFTTITTRKYTSSISIDNWNNTLNQYFDKMGARREIKNVAAPRKEDFVFLNCVYLNLFTAADQLSGKKFDVEHLAPKEQMKQLIQKCGGEGLPISSIGNICYLPEFLNRGKGKKTIYQVYNIDTSEDKKDLNEIERKYSFTTHDDLEWIELLQSIADSQYLVDEYLNFLRKRFKCMKKLFFASFDIVYNPDNTL